MTSLNATANCVIVERSIRNVFQYAIEHPSRKPENEDGGNDNPHSDGTHIERILIPDKISLPILGSHFDLVAPSFLKSNFKWTLAPAIGLPNRQLMKSMNPIAYSEIDYVDKSRSSLL